MEATDGTTEILDGQWRVGEVIGRGAVADVHAGIGPDGRPCAIKVIRPDDLEAVARFEREIEALEGVDHPGIVGVLDHGRCLDGRPYVVLERVEGGSLEERLAAGPMDAFAVAALGASLADALAHAHQRGVVHRDVKPANILLGADGRPILVDFGIARLAGGTTLTGVGWAVGTPAYLAPEQVRGEDAGSPIDVFALGLVLLEAATGERAFPGEGVPAALARLDVAVPVPDDLPPRLAGAIRAMTRREPSRRPSAADAAERLAAVADAGSTTAFPIASTATTAIPVPVVAAPAPATPPVAPVGPASEPLPGEPTGRRRRTAWIIGAVVAAIVVLSLAVAAGDDGAGSGSGDVITEAPAATVTTVPPTTAAPTTEAPAPPPPGGGGNGNGNGGGNGNGNGHDRPGKDR